MALVKIAQVRFATDSSMATITRTTGTQFRTALEDLIGQIGAGIIAQNPNVIAAAEAAIQSIVSGYFANTANAGLYTFPNASEPAPSVMQVKFQINPAQITPAVASFNNVPTTSGDGVISVRSPNTAPGTWGNSIDSTAQQPTSGTEGVYAVVNVGTADGVSRVRLKSISTTEGLTRAIGGVVATKFESGDVKYIRWTIGGTGKYALQRYSGTTLSNGSSRTIAQSDVPAKPDDLVDLQYFRQDGLAVLTVNGAVAAIGQLTTAERAGHVSASYAGMWGRGDNAPSNKLGGWQWLEPVVVGTVNRRMLSVDSTLTMPADVKLNPAQKRQAVGPRFDIRDYGAKVDGVYLTNVTTFAGQAYVESASGFTSADIGKRVAVMGAGPDIPNANDRVWQGTILSISESGIRAILDTNATFSVTGARCIYGTTDDLAIAQAQKAAVRAGGGTVWFPPGRTIATQSLYVEDNVSFAGYSRNKSWVHLIMDKPGTSGNLSGTIDWLSAAGRNMSNPLLGCDIHDFGINAEAMVRTDGYNTATKPLNLYYVKRCSVERMNVWNTPATSIPFDHPIDWCVVRDNYVVNPGRLAPSGIGPGGSGIGVGTRGDGELQPMLIENNVIIGGHAASVPGAGHNGIFTEAQTGADPDQGNVGYRIVGNLIAGMPYGISDTGSTGTIIEANQIIGCGTGVRLAPTTLSGSYPGLHATVAHNVIKGSTGPGENQGTGIAIWTQPGREGIRSYLHALIEGNQIFEGSGWGIRVFADTVDIDGVVLRGNIIRANGLSGIRLATAGAKLRALQIRDNQIVGNGQLSTAGDTAGILVASGATIEGGRIQDNDIYDLASTPTQTDVIVTAGATLTGVRRAGNTGDA